MNIQFPINYGLLKVGLPLIIVKLFDNDICLLLDTGSNRNIIDYRIYNHFKEKLLETKNSDNILTLSGQTKGVEVFIPFVFEGVKYNEPFVCTDNTNSFDVIRKESGVQIHGILGNNFFLKEGWVIDFDKQLVSIKI
jgi:hypothetical protein